MTDNNSFARYLKSLRESKEWTLQEVAAKTGISHSSISRMENAKQFPEDPSILKKLAAVYDITHEEMLEAAGILEAREFGLSPELLPFNELLKNLPKEKREELLNYAKYLNEQIKRGE
jgi:transcriptional regulator with XRE-family HTH domain